MRFELALLRSELASLKAAQRKRDLKRLSKKDAPDQDEVRQFSRDVGTRTYCTLNSPRVPIMASIVSKYYGARR